MGTDILLRLSAEHPSLPALEAEGLFSAIDPGMSIEKVEERLLLAHLGIDRREAEAAAQRLALTREASRVLTTMEDLDDPIDPETLKELEGEGFLVRARGFGPRSQEVERNIGRSILAEADRRGIPARVSVKAPSIILRLERVEDGGILSRLVPKPVRSEYSARARSRPFRHPVAMDPVLARAMVNMSGTLEGESLLDPFCGTGTILHEAGLVGARIFGMDASGSMVAGTKLNLSGLEPHLLCGDALRAARTLKMTFDHVVTDPPYGRASPRRTGATSRDLLASFPSACAGLLGRRGTLCFASPSTLDLADDLEGAGFKLKAFAYQRIHGSLGRHLYLAQAS